MAMHPISTDPINKAIRLLPAVSSDSSKCIPVLNEVTPQGYHGDLERGEDGGLLKDLVVGLIRVQRMLFRAGGHFLTPQSCLILHDQLVCVIEQNEACAKFIS